MPSAVRQQGAGLAPRLRAALRRVFGLSSAAGLSCDATGGWWLHLPRPVPAHWQARYEIPGVGWWLALRAADRVHWLWVSRRRLPRPLAAALGVALRSDRRGVFGSTDGLPRGG
ncbi:MAG: hypothetical protein EBZ40_06605 [Gammaproteobacteria bacterium]|nr:hypothetical protein [Gammaproteobacteria bacterium]